MSPARRCVMVLVLLGLPLAVTPPAIFTTQLALAGLCLFCVLLLQLRTTKNFVDITLAFIALWALLSVMAGPFMPALHGLGDTLRAVTR